MEFQRVQDAIAELKRVGGIVEEVVCADTSQAQNLEIALKMKLPASVGQFYSHYDYLQVGPYEFEWVRNLPSLVERERKELRIPKNYLPILGDGMGGYFCVLCSEADAPPPKNFGHVVHRGAGTSNAGDTDCGEFFEFLLSRIKNAHADQ